MNIFAMDTSSLTATVAVLSDEKLLGEYSVSNKLTHSRTILPMTDELLGNLSMTLKDIDVFAVCVGPGSFTGLRIGMATVKTFAQTLDKPIIGVSSLDAIAYNFAYAEDYIICPIVDARRGEVYNALYHNGEKSVYDRALPLEELLCELEGKKVIFCGDASIAYQDEILSRSESSWKLAPQTHVLPRASSAAYIAYLRAQKQDYDNLFALEPVYLRKSQAERELEEKNK